MSAPASLYETLGVSAHASSDEIRTAYRQLCLACHPDKAGTTEAPAAPGGDGTVPTRGASPMQDAAELFHKVQRAWEVLRDPALRAVHDRELSLAEQRAAMTFQDEVDVGDMDECEDTQSYTYACRCGDVYLLPKRELEAVQASIAIPCHSCSNYILVRQVEEAGA